MLFNSIEYLIFFVSTFVLYVLIPKRTRCFFLLCVSVLFYALWNIKVCILFLFTILLSYAEGAFIHKLYGRKKKFFFIISLVSILLPLFVFKYFNFFVINFNFIVRRNFFSTLDLILPVGISFYTFQILGYLIDIYNKKIEPERNFVKYALFITFFPQLVAGPIERTENLLCQIEELKSVKVLCYERISKGLLLIGYGLFKKLVVADRISILVSTVYNGYKDFGFVELAFATILFAFQIYFDFSAYTDIARGSAKILGIELQENFRQPYFAQNIRDFWRRWHISLTSWFTDYVYIPLGGNRKGTLRKCLNLSVVFIFSGLWHGASWKFILWGGVHLFSMILYEIKKCIVKDNNESCFSSRLLNRLLVFIIVDFAWIFFASNSLTHSINIIRQMKNVFITKGIFSCGLNLYELIVVFFSITFLMFIDFLKFKKIDIYSSFEKQQVWFKSVAIAVLVLSIIILGVYGVSYDESKFIYFQF